MQPSTVSGKKMQHFNIQRSKGRRRAVCLLISALAALIIALLPPPAELSRQAMVYMGIFAGMVIALSLKAMPEHICMLAALLCLVVFGVAPFTEVFEVFSSSTMWLIIGVFGFSAGLMNSGLIKRLTLLLLKPFPHTYLGQVLAIITICLILSPIIPSVYAKTAIMGPVAMSISQSSGFKKSDRGAIGLFLAMYMSAGIFGYAFLTGSAAIPIMTGLLPEGTHLTFLSWLSFTCIWLVVLAVCTFVLTAVVLRPDSGTAIKGMNADAQLAALGPMSAAEKKAAVILVASILLWMTESLHGISSTLVALLALCAFAVTGLLSTREFGSRLNWPTFVTIGGGLAIAQFIETLGVGAWLCSVFSGVLSPLAQNPYIYIPALCILVYLARFLLVSPLSALTLFYAIFSPIAARHGIHPFVTVFVTYIASQSWNTPYNNTILLSTLATTEDSMVDFKDIFPAGILYLAVCIGGFLLSIPLWRLLGYIS